jgi:hypothetical protein
MVGHMRLLALEQHFSLVRHTSTSDVGFATLSVSASSEADSNLVNFSSDACLAQNFAAID